MANTQVNGNVNDKVSAYLRAYARLVEAAPGTRDFDIEQESVDALWGALDINEKSIAYEGAEPYRNRLRLKGKG